MNTSFILKYIQFNQQSHKNASKRKKANKAKSNKSFVGSNPLHGSKKTRKTKQILCAPDGGVA
jgi:hypothetical protein